MFNCMKLYKIVILFYFSTIVLVAEWGENYQARALAFRPSGSPQCQMDGALLHPRAKDRTDNRRYDDLGGRRRKDPEQWRKDKA